MVQTSSQRVFVKLPKFQPTTQTLSRDVKFKYLTNMLKCVNIRYKIFIFGKLTER